jgi:hypothetical protein
LATTYIFSYFIFSGRQNVIRFLTTIRQLAHRRPLVALLIALLAGSAIADEVSVHFHDRESISGELDKRTSEEKIWLRVDTGSTKVLRGFRWSNVKAATYHGKDFTAEKLKKHAQRIANTKTVVRPFDHQNKPGWLGGPTYAHMVREALGMIGQED